VIVETPIAPDYQLEPRMQLKRQAIPLPRLEGKSVLDVGCDFGYWAWLSLKQGAARVVGIDRNRSVRGIGMVDLVQMNRETARKNGWSEKCSFHEMNVGAQYHDLGRFDVVYVFSLYHHIFSAAGGDHRPVWYWLRRQMKAGGELLWENPVDKADAVVRMNMPPDYWDHYSLKEIIGAASEYFEAEYVGPALHEPTRQVWRFTAKPDHRARLHAFVERGGNGASKAFRYADGRRMKEIEKILGFAPYAGSLNLRCATPFPWEECYFRSQLLDVEHREKGLDSPWVLKWVRFYPVKVNGEQAYALRFEADEYAPEFVEVISRERLNIPNVMGCATYAGPWKNAQTGETAIDVELVLEK
jgi:SAM-dependent methyltransferase